jgi:hypothetical protein
VRLEITQTTPAFGGRSFGTTGAYERVIGKAYGEVDPQSPSNAMIQDLAAAPKNARGMVEYSTDIEILRPADRAKSNGVLFFNILNRGNKGGLVLFNADIPGGPVNIGNINAVTEAGDGFMQQQGYTLVWFGWQPDVVAGNNRMTMQVPVATRSDGSAITGTVRNELTTLRPTTTLPLQSGWFTIASQPYPTVDTDNRKPLADGFLPTLTVRVRENEPRSLIPNADWSFGSCEDDKPVVVSDIRICYPAGFKPGRLYELTYRAKDPLVLGLGFAAARDLGAFLKTSDKDDSGTSNPAYVAGAKAVVMGSSQSGRFIRSLIHLGFNRDEQGKVVFEGALPHIGGGLIPLNVRFGQPGRATNNTIDHLFPGTEFPFAYGWCHRPADRPHPGHPGPLHGDELVSEDRPRRDSSGTVGAASIAGIYRSAGHPGSRRTGERSQLYHGLDPTRGGRAAAACQGAIWLLPAAAQSEPSHLDHACIAHPSGRLGKGWRRAAAEQPSHHCRRQPGCA